MLFAVKIYRNPDLIEYARNEFEIMMHLRNHSYIVSLMDEEFYFDQITQECFIVL